MQTFLSLAHTYTPTHFIFKERYARHVEQGSVQTPSTNTEALTSFIEAEAEHCLELCELRAILAKSVAEREQRMHTCSTATTPPEPSSLASADGQDESPVTAVDDSALYTSSDLDTSTTALHTFASTTPNRSPVKASVTITKAATRDKSSRPLITPTKTPTSKPSKKMRPPLSDKSMRSLPSKYF